MSDRPTPIVDAATFDLEIKGDAYLKRVEYPCGNGDYVPIELARQLERVKDELVETLEAAQRHLEYYGYGRDSWERECSEGLPEQINQALANAKALNTKTP